MYTILRTLLIMAPVNVGPMLTMTELAPMVIVFSRLVQNHAEDLRVWRDYNDVERDIIWVIKAIVSKVYFWTLRNRHKGYATVRSLDILTHLQDTYGMLKDENIEVIYMALNKPTLCCSVVAIKMKGTLGVIMIY